MDEAEDSAALAQLWLARLDARATDLMATAPQAATSPELPAPSALAALAAEALARQKTLLVVTADDESLPDISNAIDLNLRPLCLVLPAADHASRIALRATLSLLMSRLSRAGDDAEGPVWARQRERLGARGDLWRDCLAWSRRDLDKEPWPLGLEELFPVRILPLALARTLGANSAWVVLAESARMPETARAPWPGAQRTLLLGGAPAIAGGALTAADPVARQRAEIEVLTQELSELELELATAQAEVADFTHRYHALIGKRLSTLDALRAKLADHRARAEPANGRAGQEADAARERAEQSRRESEQFDRFSRFSHGDSDTARSFSPSGDVKKLFRTLAQKIHPDRARNEQDRAWRTQLMAEANRAYRAGDEAALQEVFALWREGAWRETLARPDADSLTSQLTSLKRRIAEIERELNRLFGSRLYELFTASNIARRARRDLLQEMADRLDADIASARAQLERQA